MATAAKLEPQFGQHHYYWTEAFNAERRLDDAMAEAAIIRVMAPANAIRGVLWQILGNAVNNGDRETANQTLMALDCLTWPEFEAVSQISARVASHLRATSGTLEDVLQQAMYDAGIGTAEEANELLRNIYRGNTARSIKEVWPDFDPEYLSVNRPRDVGLRPVLS